MQMTIHNGCGKVHRPFSFDNKTIQSARKVLKHQVRTTNQIHTLHEIDNVLVIVNQVTQDVSLLPFKIGGQQAHR